ncbi:PTS sugar transporter subunit IIA [Clostridium carnis]
MVGIIVTGHGNFATGMLSSLELIAGKSDKLIGVDFTAEDSTETLEVKIEKAMNEFDDEIIVLSDLAGGSPFKVSAILGQKLSDKKIQVVAGTNLGMLIEVSLCREGMSVEELVDFAINSGSNAIKAFALKEKEEVEEDEEFDGI